MATYYVCKYTPLEIIEALGGTPVNLNTMQEGFDQAELLVGANICGFGKTVIESVYNGDVRELVLVNCCDSIKSVYDVLADSGKLDFLYLFDVMRGDGPCARDWMAAQIKEFVRAYGKYRGCELTAERFCSSFHPVCRIKEPHVSIMGARMGAQLFEMVQGAMPYPVENMTCVNNRSIGETMPPESADLDELIHWYAGELVGQLPCMRMVDVRGRRRILEDPNLRGVVYHTVRFCDFYGLEYSQIKSSTDLPLVKIESDYTTQSAGQLSTRLEAFAESIAPGEVQSIASKESVVADGHKKYYAGIDSGSTSTDVVILDEDKTIVAMLIVPTGAGASASADAALDKACEMAGITRDDIIELVTTGYGRSVIEAGNKSVTEITCHARGVHFIDPSIRTIIDIGGQDSKAISLDEEGNVVNFTMNDKCAAGTGRFLDMMARTMEMNLDRMSERGINYKEDITISSMCSVFAESEVVSLIAQNKEVDDIVHGLNKAVAVKTKALVKRVNGTEPFMMTGGVSRNHGLVKTLEEKLDAPIVISEYAQLCGALGAALLACE